MHHAANGEADNMEVDQSANQQRQCCGHRTEVGVEIDDVRRQQKSNDDVE